MSEVIKSVSRIGLCIGERTSNFANESPISARRFIGALPRSQEEQQYKAARRVQQPNWCRRLLNFGGRRRTHSQIVTLTLPPTFSTFPVFYFRRDSDGAWFTAVHFLYEALRKFSRRRITRNTQNKSLVLAPFNFHGAAHTSPVAFQWKNDRYNCLDMTVAAAKSVIWLTWFCWVQSLA